MASSRKVGTNEEVATYGTGKTYTSLATWEGDTDINLVTATKSCVLEVYGDSYNDGNCTLSGATTSSSYFRIIRPTSGNKLTSGAISTKHFEYVSNSANKLFGLNESNSEIQDIVAKRTSNFNAIGNCFYCVGDLTNCGFVGCVAIDCANAYTGKNNNGFYIGSTNTAGNVIYVKNCLAHNNDGSGIYFNYSSGTLIAYNCTATDNAVNGIYGNNSTYCLCYGCGSDGNGTDYYTSGLTLVNCSDSTPTFASGTDNFHLGATDSVWKDADTNTGSWHSSCGYDDDVDGDTRSGSWDIGWDEVASSGPTPAIKVGGAWKETTSQKIMIGGAWKTVTAIKQKVDGLWKVIS